jgi:hypothetical protein
LQPPYDSDENEQDHGEEHEPVLDRHPSPARGRGRRRRADLGQRGRDEVDADRETL